MKEDNLEIISSYQRTLPKGSVLHSARVWSASWEGLRSVPATEELARDSQECDWGLESNGQPLRGCVCVFMIY